MSESQKKSGNAPASNNKITNTNTESEKIKHKYKGFTLKERLVPSILLALLAPLTVFIIAPFEIYGNNIDEFKFILSDFIGLCLIFAAASAVVISAILLISRWRIFDVLFGLILGISVMFFIQSTFFSMALTSLDGDGTAGELPMGLIILNTALWIILPLGGAAVMLFLNKFKSTVSLVASMLVGIMLFMSVVSFATISLTTDVYSDAKLYKVDDTIEETRLLTVENLDTLATDKNIVVFLVDRFDQRYVDEAMIRNPEIFDSLDGFTYFDDFISHYPRTFPSIPFLISGVTTDFSSTRNEYFEQAYKTSPLMNTMKDAGYDINIYTDDYYGYTNATHMSDYATNISLKMEYEIVEKESLSLDMLRLSLYRSLPFVLRNTVGEIRTSTFDKYVAYDDTEHEVFRTNMNKIYDLLTKDDFTFREEQNGYSFIHLSGCHVNNPDDMNRVMTVMKDSFRIISRYIDEMKRMGVYENSTIIIMGDHASIGSDVKDPYYPHMTALYVKPSGVSSGDIKTSSAPITTSDIFATILGAAEAKLDSIPEKTVFDIPEDMERTRYYFFQTRGGGYDCVTYAITGKGNDLANWKEIDRYHIDKDIYD